MPDRYEACNDFIYHNQGIDYGHAHTVIDDKNMENSYIYSAIYNIAHDLAEESSDYDMATHTAHRILRFLVCLLDSPMPDWWMKDNDYHSPI